MFHPYHTRFQEISAKMADCLFRGKRPQMRCLHTLQYTSPSKTNSKPRNARYLERLKTATAPSSNASLLNGDSGICSQYFSPQSIGSTRFEAKAFVLHKSQSEISEVSCEIVSQLAESCPLNTCQHREKPSYNELRKSRARG